MDVVRGEGVAEGLGEMPLHLGLGSDTYNVMSGVLSGVLEGLEKWKDVTVGTDYPAAAESA